MKKIMFNDHFGLNDAVLEKRKTMTRRVDKKLNHPLVTHISELGKDGKGKAYFTITYSTGLTEDVYPAYQIGEEIAIAQAYNTLLWPSVPGIDWNAIVDEVTHAKGWKNKMFVKAEYMPHRIRTTDIKVERLQDISEEDCLREGIVKTDCVAPYGFPVGNGKWKNYRTPQDAFASLIDKVSGKGTWNSNPWVLAYDFELVK